MQLQLHYLVVKEHAFAFMDIITHSQREAYMVLLRNGGSGSGSGGGRQLSQNLQAI